MDEQELLNWIPRQVYEDAQKTWKETKKQHEVEIRRLKKLVDYWHAEYVNVRMMVE